MRTIRPSNSSQNMKIEMKELWTERFNFEDVFSALTNDRVSIPRSFENAQCTIKEYDLDSRVLVERTLTIFVTQS